MLQKKFKFVSKLYSVSSHMINPNPKANSRANFAVFQDTASVPVTGFGVLWYAGI